MALEVSAAPAMHQLQSVQKAMALPTVGAAVEQVGALYTRVKGAHSLLEWALTTAEAGVQRAATTAAPFVAAPLASADARVAAALDQLEKRVPLVTEQPKVIVETTKQAVLARVSPQLNKSNEIVESTKQAVISRVSPQLSKVYVARAAAEQRVKSLKDLSWAKANALLSTAYGQKALQGVDTGASYAMQLLDHYLPPTVQEEASAEIVPATSDPALHTMQTVGRLSAVAARRVWANLAHKINDLRQSGLELDVRRYVAALLAALHLADVTRAQAQHEHKQDLNATPPAPAPAPAAAPAPAPRAHDSAPSTADQLKTTPEGKSKATNEGNIENNN